MTPTTLIRSLAAACAAAVFLPAQKAPQIVIQGPQPSLRVTQVKAGAEVDDLKVRLAEVIVMLEEDDMTPAERSKAKQKLLEIVARLSKDKKASGQQWPTAVFNDGRVVVRRRAGDGDAVEFDVELEGVAVEVDAKANAKAKADLRKRFVTLDRLQEKGFVTLDRLLRPVEVAEAEGAENAQAERHTRLLRQVMGRRRADAAAEHAEHEQHAEHAPRQFETARRALEQAREQLQKAQAEFEAAHGGQHRDLGITSLPQVKKAGAGINLQLDTKLDRILPPKDGKAKQKNNVFYFGEGGGGAAAEGHGEIRLEKVEQGKGEQAVTLRWLEDHAKAKAKADEVGKEEVDRDAAERIRWRVVTPKDVAEAREKNVFHLDVQAEAPKDGNKRGNVFYYIDPRAQAPEAEAKGEDVRVYFRDLSEQRAAAGDDDDEGDVREMIEALRKEMRELRRVLREVKAHIGAAAPADRRLPAPSVPPSPYAHPGARHVAPGEVRSARVVPGIRATPARVRAPRPEQPRVVPPQPAPQLLPAPPRRASAPIGLGGIE